MSVRFTGGPLDGQTLDHHQIDALVVDCPMLLGNRDFVTVPALDDWQRILAGELAWERRLRTSRMNVSLGTKELWSFAT